MTWHILVDFHGKWPPIIKHPMGFVIPTNSQSLSFMSPLQERILAASMVKILLEYQVEMVPKAIGIMDGLLTRGRQAKLHFQINYFSYSFSETKSPPSLWSSGRGGGGGEKRK